MGDGRAKNFTQLLGVGVLTLEPERDEAGAVELDRDGNPAYPRLREFTRNNPDYPHLQGMQEWFSFQRGESRTYVLASDVVFMKALRNTFLFVLVVAPVQGGIALLLALMINQKLRGINFFRAVYFMPVVVSIVVVSLLWRFIYAGDNGLLNNVLSWVTFGAFEPVDWLGNPSTALPAIIAMSIWQAVGFHMVIWLAGLQTIPPTLYEAANIEGASRWQAFRYVTWPGLRNTAVLVLIVITMQAFALFAQIDVMTQGGPLNSTQTMVFQAVERGYRKQDIAAGSVISVVLFLIVLTISLIQRYLTPGEKLMATVEGSNRGFDRVWRYALMILGAVIFIGPLLFMVMSSLKPDAQLLSDTSSLRAFLPVGDISLSNYFSAFGRAPVATFIFNSVLVTGVTVVLSLFVCSLAAFSFVFMKWRGRDVLLAIIIATLIVPFETIAIPMLIVVNNLPWIGPEGISIGWLNSYRVQIVPFISDGLTIFLFVQFFKDLPRELIEACRVEGATWFQIYWRVVMPLSGPVIATAAILKFLYMYNQYLWPLMVTQAEVYRPVMVGLQYFFQLNTAWGELMAYLSVITVPVLAFYLILQRAFISSIASTGVKG